MPARELPERLDHGLGRWLVRPPSCLRLASLPTPCERATWLEEGRGPVYIKRDDQTSALYGGGKVRKLEWILANAPFAGETPVLSVGGLGSHHLVALALFLRPLGRTLHALTFEQVVTPHALLNLATLASCETRFWHVRRRLGLPLAYLRYRLLQRPQVAGTFLAAGASTPLGCLGFVDAGLEFAAQVDRGELPKPGMIFVAAGTCGVAAGLAVGLALAGVATRIVLVSTVEPLLLNRWLFEQKLSEVYRLLVQLGLRESERGRERIGNLDSVGALLRRAGVTWEIDHAQVGAGYGVPTPAALEAVARAKEAGVALETTYTGKCVAALRASTRGLAPALFWNTHGGNDLTPHVVPHWREALPPRLAHVVAAAPALRALPALGG